MAFQATTAFHIIRFTHQMHKINTELLFSTVILLSFMLSKYCRVLPDLLPLFIVAITV